MQVIKGVIKEFQGNTDMATLEEQTGLPGAPEVSGYPWDLLLVIQPSRKGEVVQCAVYQVTFNRTSNGI